MYLGYGDPNHWSVSSYWWHMEANLDFNQKLETPRSKVGCLWQLEFDHCYEVDFDGDDDGDDDEDDEDDEDDVDVVGHVGHHKFDFGKRPLECRPVLK